jgi:hypothetical protein
MVEGTRFQLVGLLEWLIAAAAVVGLLAVGNVVSRDFRSVRPVVPVIAGAARSALFSALARPGAVSVPILVLPDGRTLAVGDPESALEFLGARAESAPAAFERLDSGQRELRTYQYAGMDFMVVTVADKIVAIFR